MDEITEAEMAEASVVTKRLGVAMNGVSIHIGFIALALMVTYSIQCVQCDDPEITLEDGLQMFAEYCRQIHDDSTHVSEIKKDVRHGLC